MDAVLIDIGGVLTVDPWEALLLTPDVGLADRMNVDRTVMETAGQSLWAHHATATTTEADYWAELTEIIGAPIPEPLVAEVEAATLVATPEAQVLLARLRASGLPWGFITNNTAFWYPKQLALLGVEPDEAQWVFNSSGSRVQKSDPGQALFEIAAEQLLPRRTLVVDDRDGNVDRAQQSGFEARKYQSGGHLPF